MHKKEELLLHCPSGGFVVTDEPIPNDPSERFRGETGHYWYGCNRLRCTRCGHWVRYEQGLSLEGEPGVTVLPEELFADQDWSQREDISSFARHTAYSCNCFIWCGTTEAMDPSDRDPGDPVFPWTCAGHPLPTFPLELDGMKYVEWRFGWLWRLYGRLEGIPAAERVPKALLQLSREDPARFLGATLKFFGQFPWHPQANELWSFLQSEPSLLAQVHRVRPSMRSGGNEAITVLPLVVSRLEAEGKGGDGKAPLLQAMDQAMSNPEIRPSWDEFWALLSVAPEWLVLYALDFAERGLWTVDSILGSFKLQTNRALLVVAGVALAKSEKQEIRWAVRGWLHPVVLSEHVYAAIEQALPADDPPKPKTEWE
jgi:hypothetical protein